MWFVSLLSCAVPEEPRPVAPLPEPVAAKVPERPLFFEGLSPMTAAERAGSHCGEGERIAYSCKAKGKVFSVCLSAARVAYRFGPLDHPEITLASDGTDGLFYFTWIRGGNGGEQQSIGFINEKYEFINERYEYVVYEYVVFSAEYGAATLRADDTESGVVVMRDGREVSRILCPEKGERQRIDSARLPRSEDKHGWF